MEMFNLPSYTKGKTFAEASRLINKKFKGQDDKDSQATLQELQGRLQQAQEYVKQQTEPAVTQAPSPDSSELPVSTPAGAVAAPAISSDSASGSGAPNQFFFGGDADGTAEMTNEQKAREGKKFKSSSASVAETGLMGEEGNALLEAQGKDPSTGEKVAGTAGTVADAASGIGGKAGGYAAAASGVISLGMDAFGDTGVDTSGETLMDNKDKNKRGESIGGAALKGAAIGTSILPGWGTAIGAVVGGAAGWIGSGRRKRDEKEQQARWTARQSKEINNRYAEGGDLDQPEDYSDIFALKDNALRNNNSSAAHVIKAMNLRGGAKGIAKVGSSGQEAMKANIAASNKKTTTSPTFVEGEEAGAPKSKFNAGALLRYAPAAMNAYQFAKLEKPSDEQYGRINAKYEKDMVDEKSIQNVVGQDVANMRNKILASSGGSASGTRASLLASQLKGTKALSDAYMQAENINRGENRKAQDFNLNVAKTNLQQSNMETQAKAANEGAYKTQRSKLLAQLGNDLGAVGKEELLKKYPEMMGMDYDERGRYIAKLEAEKKKKKASKKK